MVDFKMPVPSYRVVLVVVEGVDVLDVADGVADDTVPSETAMLPGNALCNDDTLCCCNGSVSFALMRFCHSRASSYSPRLCS
jgi:hypothetical protein